MRYEVREQAGGASVCDTERDINIAWCGNNWSVCAEGSVRTNGVEEATRICALLNDSEKS